MLNVDTVYILREVTAPEGYDKAEDTEFSFDAYGNLTVHSGPDAEWVGDTTLNLYDTKRDVTITKQVTEEVVRRVDRVVHTVRSIPQTGDGRAHCSGRLAEFVRPSCSSSTCRSASAPTAGISNPPAAAAKALP